GGMAEFTNDGELVRVIKNPADSPYAYDVAVKPDVNRMITSSFTPLRNYRKPLPQWDMKDGGNTLLVWDFKERKVIQTLTTDPVPLEVRWSVRPGKAHGWTNSALGDSIWFFAQGKDGKFATKKVADLGKGCLPADLRQSPDDRYLYVSCFMKSEIQAWDVSTPDRPRSRHAAELRWTVASSGLWPRRCSSAQRPPPGGTSRRRLRRRAGD